MYDGAIEGTSEDPAEVFHAGERAVQERMGVRDRIEPWARRVVRPYLPEQHRSFYRALPFVVLAARDASGRPWATIAAGSPGFVRSPDPTTVVLPAGLDPDDPLAAALRPGVDVGLLGIDLHTRRRNRVNGRLGSGPAGELRLEVEQSFGNCPQHITPRRWRVVEPASTGAARRLRALDPELVARIRGADTLFIATGHRGQGDHAAFGMDASHRGGSPGFVAVPDERTIVIPDYAGNDHFNTVGNLVQDPRAGITFVDFEGGGVLQLTGRVWIDWDSPRVRDFPGAQRLIVLEIEEAIERPEALPLRWESAGASIRSLRVVRRMQESEDVVSLELAARDGGALPTFRAGQHLPIELRSPGHERPVRRSYSLSGPPGAQHYRISVKRVPEGAASSVLHAVEPGAIVDAFAPAGDFVLAPGHRPILLVSAGIGVTPVLAMLHELVESRDPRPVWFVHGARDGDHHPLAAEVDALVARHATAERCVTYSRPGSHDRIGFGFDRVGRIDAALLESLLPGLDADLYLCGPSAFMSELGAALLEAGADPDRIHVETFAAG